MDLTFFPKRKKNSPHVKGFFFTRALNRERKEELDGEIFEILLTFSDFMAFKEMVLDYRAVSTCHGRFNFSYALSSKFGQIVDCISHFCRCVTNLFLAQRGQHHRPE